MNSISNSEQALSKNERITIAILLIVICLLVISDLLSDSREGVNWPHLAVELLVASSAAIGFFILIRSTLYTKQSLARSEDQLRKKEAETQLWRSESQKWMEGLGAAIDSQFIRWGLTEAEKEVALLLLKGLSLKEISTVRATSEKTVRTHASAIYSKSELAGRSELAAYFLEDLLLPRSQREPGA